MAVRDEDLSADEIRGRVTAGVAAVGLRALGVRAVGLLTNVVLARLLLPRDFGVLAFGQTLVMFGSLLTDVGMGAGLIRQAKAPSVQQLEAFFGLQLLTTTVFAGVAIAVMTSFGRIGQVAAIMTSSLIFASLGGPRVIMLERRLDYRAIAAADVGSGIVYSVLAIALVVLGYGIWGVGLAVVVRSAAQSAILIYRTRDYRLRAGLQFKYLRGLVSFGLKFQANTILDLARAEGINLLTLAIAGTSVLGVWSLAQRILLIPYLLFEALWRVSYPAVARLIADGVDPSADVARALRLGVFVTALLLVGLASAAPLIIPGVFGAAWVGTARVIPLASLGITIYGPISAAYGGYLYATGRAASVLTATSGAVICWFVILPVLLPQIGTIAYGVAWLSASVVEGSILTLAIGRAAAREALSAVLLPITVGTALAVGGLLLFRGEPASLGLGAAVGVSTTLLYLALVTALRPVVVSDSARLTRRMLSRLSPDRATVWKS